MSKIQNAVYGWRVPDKDYYDGAEDCNFQGFLVVDGAKAESTVEPIQIPKDKYSDQEFITNILTSKRAEFIDNGYECGAIETKKESEWFKSL